MVEIRWFSKVYRKMINNMIERFLKQYETTFFNEFKVVRKVITTGTFNVNFHDKFANFFIISFFI